MNNTTVTHNVTVEEGYQTILRIGVITASCVVPIIILFTVLFVQCTSQIMRRRRTLINDCSPVRDNNLDSNNEENELTLENMTPDPENRSKPDSPPSTSNPQPPNPESNQLSYRNWLEKRKLPEICPIQNISGTMKEDDNSENPNVQKSVMKRSDLINQAPPKPCSRKIYRYTNVTTDVIVPKPDCNQRIQKPRWVTTELEHGSNSAGSGKTAQRYFTSKSEEGNHISDVNKPPPSHPNPAEPFYINTSKGSQKHNADVTLEQVKMREKSASSRRVVSIDYNPDE